MINKRLIIVFALPFSAKVSGEKDQEEHIVKVECGINYSIVLSATGKAYSWGIANYGKLGQENNQLNKGNPGV